MFIHMNGTEAAKWLPMAAFYLRRVAREAARSGAKHLSRVIHIDATTKIRIDFRNSLAQSVAYITSSVASAQWYFYIVHADSFWTYPNGGISLVASISADTGLYDEDAGEIDRGSGAVLDTWTFTFTSPTEFDVAGAVTGDVGSGTTSSAFEPDNPLESGSYFYLDDGGWTGVWAVGDTFSFRTTPREWVSESLYYPTSSSTNTIGYSKPGDLASLVETSYADDRNLSQYVDAQLGLAVPSLWLSGYLAYDSVADSLLVHTPSSQLRFVDLGQMASSADDFVAVRRVIVTNLLPNSNDPSTPSLSGLEVEVTYPPDPDPPFPNDTYVVSVLAQGPDVTDKDGPSGFDYQLPYANRRDGGWTIVFGGANVDRDKGFVKIMEIAPNGDITQFYLLDGSGWVSDFRYASESDGTIYVYYTLNDAYVMVAGIIASGGDSIRGVRIYVDGVLEKEIPSIYVAGGWTESSSALDGITPPAVASSPDGTKVVYAIHDRIFYEDRPFDNDDREGERLAAYPAWPPEFRILVNDVESTFAVETDIGNGVTRNSGGTEKWLSYTGSFSQIAVNDSGQYVIASVSQGSDGSNAFRNRFSVFNGTIEEDPDSSPTSTTHAMVKDNGGGMGAAITPAGVGITLHRDWETSGTETTLTFRVADGSTFLWEQDVVSGTAEQIAEYGGILVRANDVRRIELFERSDATADGTRTRVFKIIIVHISSVFLFNEWTMTLVTNGDVVDTELSTIDSLVGFLQATDVQPGRPSNLSSAINLETEYALIVP